MYRNLEAELARKQISRKELAEKLGITATTLSFKLNGKSELSLAECVEIKRLLDTEEPIDYLFAQDEAQGA
jgi:transcriptional regulator with XRE-family HTH domain